MKYLLLTAFAACSLVACSEPVSLDEFWGPVDAIKSVAIVADTDTAYTDRTIIITTRCVPLVRCKGTVFVGGNGEWSHDNGWILQWPYRDTLMEPEDLHREVSIDAEFFFGALNEQQWQIRLLPQGPQGKGRYVFSARIHIDSVYLSDSSRYFWIGAQEVVRSSPNGRAYDSYESSWTAWVFYQEK